jgi:hypothetical protein
MLGLTEVELVHREQQSAVARRRIEQERQLCGDTRVLEAGAGNHVVDTLPDLVEAVGARPTAALEQRLELRWRAAQHER